MAMPQPSPATPGALNWALVLGLGVVWGTAFMGVEVALRAYPPFTVAAGRVLIGALVLLVVGPILGQGLTRIPSARGWLFACLVGIAAAAVPFSLLSWGQQHVPSAFAGVTMGAVPLLTLLLAMYFSREEGVGPRRIAGVSLGFLGLVILVGPGAFSGESPLVGWGRLACVLSACCYAVANILTRRAPRMPPIALATAALLTASLVLVPLALMIEGVPDIPRALPSAALVWVALGPTALAALVQVRIIQTAGALFMSQVSYMVPLWSVIFGILILGETLPKQLFIALGLIFTGIAFSQWSARRRR
ncbi:DMT family transporter [Ovoidimarina sediminis]|uniref:DMT family transporter n=1 Tax=Ovoidimarina sediminis TaxID=3079856 RepID=UPI002907DF0C|nr:DMT family transporter [Rhodophyticola sp. MJ-SS7]MDU8943857.1 DMT family transporter [Rhodophyticola sp. MJ-SS7]